MLHAWILITHACICDYYIFFSKCWEVLAQWHSRFVLTSVIDQKCFWSVWHSTSMQRLSEPQSLLVLKGSLSKQCWWPCSIYAKDDGVFCCGFKTPIFIFSAFSYHPHQRSCLLIRLLPGSKVPTPTAFWNWETCSFSPVSGKPSSTQTRSKETKQF